MEGVVNGFFSCLMEDQYLTNVVEYGFCGPGTADNNQISLVCAETLCCGKGMMDNAGDETAVYSCQKNDSTYYSPKKV